jgi:hypothetical protein
MLTQYETMGFYSVVTMVIKRQMCHFYIEKGAKKNLFHFEFPPKGVFIFQFLPILSTHLYQHLYQI